MTNTGTPNQESAPKQYVSLRALIWSVFAVVLALFVATQVIGVLYSILFPPDGPVLPANILEISHQLEAPGVDYWVYGTEQNSCEVMDFFRTQPGATCRFVPYACGGPDGRSFAQSTPAQQVGNCSGEMNFSIFSLRWTVNVSAHHYTDGSTHFSLLREVQWFGASSPTITPTP
jgi:hypothetical protein